MRKKKENKKPSSPNVLDSLQEVIDESKEKVLKQSNQLNSLKRVLVAAKIAAFNTMHITT